MALSFSRKKLRANKNALNSKKRNKESLKLRRKKNVLSLRKNKILLRKKSRVKKKRGGMVGEVVTNPMRDSALNLAAAEAEVEAKAGAEAKAKADAEAEDAAKNYFELPQPYNVKLQNMSQENSNGQLAIAIGEYHNHNGPLDGYITVKRKYENGNDFYSITLGPEQFKKFSFPGSKKNLLLYQTVKILNGKLKDKIGLIIDYSEITERYKVECDGENDSVLEGDIEPVSSSD